MPQQPYSTGAVLIYCSVTGPNGPPVFLGTGESSPKKQLRPHYKAVMNDISGEVPLDQVFRGEDGLISVKLTRWDEAVMQRLERMPGPAAASTPGSWALADMGLLMGLEGAAFPLWLRFAGARATMVGLPAGYRFVQTLFLGPFDDDMGTDAMKRQAIFYAWPKFDAAAARFTLYDGDMSATAGISLA